MKSNVSWFVFGAAALISAASLYAQTPSPISGTLTVGGKTHKIVSACAFEEPDPFDKAKMQITAVFWTDATPLESNGCLGHGPTLQYAAQTKSTIFLEAVLDQPKLIWQNGTFGSKDGVASFSISGSDTLQFTAATPAPIGAATLSGAFKTTKPLEIGSSTKVVLDAKVTALKIERPAPLTNQLTGAAAANSPAAKAAIRFLTAMRKNDMPAVRAMIVEDERKTFDEQLASPDGKQMISMMSSMAEDALKMPVASVVTQGGITLVTLEKKVDGGAQSAKFKLRQENGEYRITRKR
ncbi:hypothetical protein F183_A20570 [Bryobacterales bacterium F-183]|nr:hypothetical protein F183_A20570 [Bryobacterales bacterium F-183]